MRHVLYAILTSLASACATAAPAAPTPTPPTIQAGRVVVVAGPIAMGNLQPLGDQLLAWSNADHSRPVDIILESPGGDVVTGFLFVNQLEAVRAQGTTVRCFVPNLAASMAFQILLHCDERYTLDHAWLLWHRVRVFGVRGPVTTQGATELARDLGAMDDAILAELLAALTPDLKPEQVRFHFERETLHIGRSLATLAPRFIKSFPAIPGLYLALEHAPRSTLPEEGMEGRALFAPGQPVYIWSGAGR